MLQIRILFKQRVWQSQFAILLTKKQRLQEKSEIISEKMLVEGTCFASCLWRDDKGLILTADTNDQISYEGDVSIDIHDLSDVFMIGPQHHGMKCLGVS